MSAQNTNSKTETPSTWLLYPTMATGSRRIAGRYVTIQACGTMSLSPDLTAELPAAARRMRVEYDASRYLRLTPVAADAEGTIAICRPQEKKGMQARVGTRRTVLGEWGILRDKTVRYAAAWKGEFIMVDLSDTEPSAAREPVREVEPPAEARADPALLEPPAAAGDTVPTPCCDTCARGTEIKGSARQLCDSRTGPNRRKLVKPGDLCNDYKIRKATPPDGAIRAGVVDKRQRYRSNPRAICPECGTEHTVTGVGLFPHDGDGVDYRAGRGDKDNRCPGSGHRPRVDA